MSFFRKKSNSDSHNKTLLEHKLYLARENPEPFFDISGCGLKEVPTGIYSLCKVFRKESLYLHDNHLTSLNGGGSLYDLSMLQILDLHNNQLTQLPEEIGCLINLTALNASNNRLKLLPKSIGSLKSLISLDVANNRLSSIPESLFSLAYLKVLNLSGNRKVTLRKLPLSICQALSLESLQMDKEQLASVPDDVVERGTEGLLTLLAEENSLIYVPLRDREMPSVNDNVHLVNVFEMQKKEHSFKEALHHLDRLKAQRQQARLVLEMDRDQVQQREIEACCALRENRGRLLEDITREQSFLEKEVERVHHEREQDRHRFILLLQQAEENADLMITRLLQLSSEERDQDRVQERLQLVQDEEEKLLRAMQDQQRSLQRLDVLDAMKSLMEEECLREQKLREYENYRVEMARSLLSQELESSNILLNIVDKQNSSQLELIQRLQKDEELQRAAVCALLERGDAQTWSLIQQVALVEAQLATLTALELQRRKHQLSEQISDLSEKRIALSVLLLQLLEEQAARREQLLHTLNEMERQREDKTDFWLHQYQRLLDSRPSRLTEQERLLDPLLASQLVLNGVVHCLPFLAPWAHDPYALIAITDDQLKEAGVNSAVDRQNILNALRLYAEERECAVRKLQELAPAYQPSAPMEQPSTSTDDDDVVVCASFVGIDSMESECVICMEATCEVVIVPCGHMCCCGRCIEPLATCPMCRSDIERKIKVISP